MSTSVELLGKPVFSYSRAQAIADGVLVDVSPQALSAGFRYPLALSRDAWEDCAEWTAEDERKSRGGAQSVAGRIWDIVYLASMAARRGGETILFPIKRKPRPGRGRGSLVTLKMVCGPGDQGEPVITIMLTQED